MPIQAIKVRLYPSKEQENYISRLLGSDRFIHNKIVEFKRQEFEINGKTPSWAECGKYFTKLRGSDEFVWLKGVNTKVVKQAIIDVERAYSNFFSAIERGEKDFGPPKFKSKHNKETCRFPIDAFSGIIGNRLTLTKDLKSIHFKCSRFDERYLNRNQDKLKSATLEKTKSGKYFLSILIEKPITKVLPKTDKVIGIDIGIKDFIVTSDGERFANLKTIRSNEKKLKKLQRNHSKKQKGSKNKEKARLKLAKFHEKIKNRKEEYLQQISNKLINENQVIVFETLNIRGMMANHCLAKSIGELSASRFKSICKYKMDWHQKDFVEIGQFYPSSKLCECCGFKNDGLTLSDRTWICPKCGVEHDRDLNAACNIRNERLRLLEERKGQPSVAKAPGRKIGGKTSKLGLRSPDVKLEEMAMELSMNQEKNVDCDTARCR